MLDEKELDQLRLSVAAQTARFETARPDPTPDIALVQVFSGPGDFLSPLKPSNDPWKFWWDQHRLSAGILLVLQVAALNLGIPVQKVRRDHVERAGPLLVYNGIPVENEVFREVIRLSHFPIPVSRIEIQDTVEEEGKRIPIRHTGDQVKSFLEYLQQNPKDGSIALVSSASHYHRILRYFDKYLQDWRERPILRSFPVPSNPAWAIRYAMEEINSLCEYLAKDHLSANPYPANLGLV